MGPDNQNNFPNNNLGNNMPVMGPPQPTPEPQQPVMGVPQPVPDVQPTPDAQPTPIAQPEPAPVEPIQPEPAQLAQPVQPEPVLPVRSETPEVQQPEPQQPEPQQPESMLGAQPEAQPMPEQSMPEKSGMSVGGAMSGLKSKKNLIIIGAVAGVVVIAIIIAIIVIMNSGKKSSQPLNPGYNDQVTEPDENGDINGDGEESTETSVDAKRSEDYDAIIVAVNSFKSTNDGEASRLVKAKDPASLNPAKWVNATGEDPNGNSYELRAYSFDKWQSEGDLVPTISDATNGSQAFVILGATCSNVDANGNFQPAKSDDINTFAVYGYLENGLFCKDSAGNASNNDTTPTNGDFDF